MREPIPTDYPLSILLLQNTRINHQSKKIELDKEQNNYLHQLLSRQRNDLQHPALCDYARRKSGYPPNTGSLPPSPADSGVSDVDSSSSGHTSTDELKSRLQPSLHSPVGNFLSRHHLSWTPSAHHHTQRAPNHIPQQFYQPFTT
ncbi:hypothetical protein HHI36_013510, partial [Cryptolaemus montrouzieri]